MILGVIPLADPVMTIIVGAVLLLAVFILGSVVVLLSGVITFAYNCLNWLRQHIWKPKIEPEVVETGKQTSITEYIPEEKSEEEKEAETNPDADNEFSEESGYESSSVMDEEDEE